MGGSPFVCVCSNALGIFSDPPSICGDSDCMCFIDRVLMIAVCAYNLRMIPYLVFYRDVSNEEFRRLADQLKPWGVPCFVYGRRKHTRHLEERGEQGFYMGPGSSPCMERVFLREPGLAAVKQYGHALVPPALVQKHAIRMPRDLILALVELLPSCEG